MGGFCFQIVLFLAGAIIGVAVPLAPKRVQKWILAILAVSLIAVSLVWAGYELLSSNQSGVVTRAQVQRWSQVGATDRDTVYDVIYNQIHIIPGKRQFTSGATIPAGVLITTDLGNNWSQYPVKAVARNGGWGVFETMASFKAPATGEYWLIVP